MRAVAAILAGTAVIVLTTGQVEGGLADRLHSYLGPRTEDRPRSLRLDPATRRRALFAALGVLAAGLGSVAGAIDSSPLLSLPAGGLGGWLLRGMVDDRRHVRRAASLRSDVPTAADALALHVVAGATVAEAIESFAATGAGEAAADLGIIVKHYHSGSSLPEALMSAAGSADHPDAGRLYELLSHAHTTGGRLTDSLTDLATDVRGSMARDLTAESGRRALAAYGPILALMIPVTVLFLMYPTLVGLDALSGTVTP
ncbi:type II secretion system F family protein [bacterium]|nr:type II secretion system F family protein [bacterium]